jgi:hypothetical protein
MACDQKAWFEKWLPKDDVESSKKYFALLQAHDWDKLEEQIDPKLKNTNLRSGLEKMAGFFPTEQATEIQVVGANTVSSGEKHRLNITLQYEYPATWLLANIVFVRTGNETVIEGMTVRPLKDSLQNINRFTFQNKGAAHYTILLLAGAIPIFILATLIICARTPIPRKKWLWVLFIIVGFVKVSLNWTDGTVAVNPITVQFLGSGFTKASPLAPIILFVSLPVGAIVFLLKRKKWTSAANQAL